MNYRRVFLWILLFAILVSLFILPSCAPKNTQLYTDEYRIAGFWKGIWHGAIVVITFIISLFNHNVGIYEVHNTGWSYDLGFLIGCGVFTGGITNGTKAISRRK